VEEHRPEAPVLLARLDSALRPGPQHPDLPNLIASRLWERLGDVPRALRASRRHTRWLYGSAYPAEFLRQEARMALAAGDTAGAIRAARLYVRLRSAAEPSQRADLDAWRRDLARLEHSPPAR
jgi:hypothetical protein